MAVILTDNSQFNIMEQAQTALELQAVLILTLGLMVAASPIQRLIGNGGGEHRAAVMGLILAALAVQTVVDGIKQLVSPGWELRGVRPGHQGHGRGRSDRVGSFRLARCAAGADPAKVDVVEMTAAQIEPTGFKLK